MSALERHVHLRSHWRSTLVALIPIIRFLFFSPDATIYLNRLIILFKSLGFSGGSDVKEFAYSAGDMGLTSGSGRFPWRRKWQPTPVFLPGEFHGQRSLMSYSPWSCIESDMTERLSLSLTLPSTMLWPWCLWPSKTPVHVPSSSFWGSSWVCHDCVRQEG